ncbi:MAG: hypothetical protein LBJ01_02355 [Tannerella sp.]|jgi:hypothetical protein|nr:hypothetical protein [Tannerella sp.]
MKKRKNTWKIRLVPNRPAKGKSSDCIAEVEVAGRTLRNEDIARAITGKGKAFFPVAEKCFSMRGKNVFP